MNVLFSCAGRRNYLLQYFREALEPGEKIIAVDASLEAPAVKDADIAIQVPPVSSPSYLDILVKICLANDVGLVVSLNDLELPLLAKNKTLFSQNGINVAVSSSDVIDICFDKWKTTLFARKIGIRTAKTYLTKNEAEEAVKLGELQFPVVVKPRWGTASIAVEFANNLDELNWAYGLAKSRVSRSFLADISSTNQEQCILIQECLKGQEYGLDIVNDLSGKHICTFAKKKLAMRAGETDRACTMDTPEIISVGTAIGENLCHVGNCDCDLFFNSQGCFLLELNPRFGGGYPFSQVAGANLPAALLAWAKGRNPAPDWFKVKPGVISSKCDRLVIIKDRLEI